MRAYGSRPGCSAMSCGVHPNRPRPNAWNLARAGAPLVCGLAFLLTACSQARTTGFVRQEFFDPGQRIAFASEGPLAQALTGELGARGFRIVERTQLVTVLNEHALRQTGLLEEERTLAAGRIMNVNYLINVNETGPSSTSAQRMSAVVKILDVQSGEVVGSFNYVDQGTVVWPMFMMARPIALSREDRVDAARRIADAIMSQRKK